MSDREQLKEIIKNASAAELEQITALIVSFFEQSEEGAALLVCERID